MMPICILCFAARNIHSLSHAKIFAPLVVTIHGQTEDAVTLAWPRWSLKGDLIWILLEPIALIILLHLPTLLRLTKNCKKEYHYLRRVLHALLHIATTP